MNRAGEGGSRRGTGGWRSPVEGGPGLERLATHASSWMTAAQAARHGIQFSVMVLMARLLQPEDFGLFAMAAVFMELFLVLSDFDVGSLIVSRRNLDELQLSSLCWLSLFAGLAVAGVSLGLTPWLVRLYGEPRLADLLRLLALAFVLGPPGAVAMGILQRRLDFRLVAVVEVLSLATGGVVAMVLAFRGWRSLSLVGLTLGALGARALLAWAVVGWRPAAVLSLVLLREPMRFALNRTLHRALYVVHKHTDAFLLGRYIGAVGLGHYRVASHLVLTPLLSLGLIVWRVSLPLFASIQGELDRIRSGYLRGLGWLLLVVLPVVGWVFGSAGEVVAMLFGPPWEPAAPIVRILCLAGAAQVLISTLDPVLLALGRSDLLLKLEVTMLPLNVAFLWVGLRGGPEGVAWGSLGSVIVMGFLWFVTANRVLGLSFASYVPAILWPVVAMVATASAGMLAGTAIGDGAGLHGRLLMQGIAAGVAGSVVLSLGRPRALEDIARTALRVVAWRA